MQFKKGPGWKACYDEERELYTAERSWRGFYQLCQIDREIYERLETGTAEDDPDALIASGRHLFEADDDYNTSAPTATVYDEDYAELAPWSRAKARAERSAVITNRELTDFMVENFPGEEKNREYRERNADREDPPGSVAVRPFSADDLPLMRKWLTDVRVLEFYEGRDYAATDETLAEHFLEEIPGGFRMIILYRGMPVGYAQAYRLNGDGFREYGWEDDGRTVFAMDQFIGEPEYWNRGIGSSFLLLMSSYLKKYESAGIILLDPHKNNPRAIRAYLKAGFEIVKELPAHELFEGRYADCFLMAKEL